MSIKLYSYWRSSAAYRVRIALNLKGLEHEIVPVNLVEGDHKKESYGEINPQGLVPALSLDGLVLNQSLAILEYLEERYPEKPLLPESPVDRARVRSMALLIACEIHPLNNLRVLKYLVGPMGVSHDAKDGWYREWIAHGFSAYETLLSEYGGRFSFGDQPTIADAFLVPQVYNARRFDCPLEDYPRLVQVEQNCLSLDAFVEASPERQTDAT